MKKIDDKNNKDHNAEQNQNNDEIRVLSSDDEKIKVVGEVLANESSRSIMKLLSCSSEMTINQISQEMDLSIPLVSHHLKKMQETGVVKVSRVGTSVKGQKMKYYSATNRSFLITPPERQIHSLFHSLQKFSKFAAIGLAGLVSWSIARPNETTSVQISEKAESLLNPELSTIDEWSSASEAELDMDGDYVSIENDSEQQMAERALEPAPSPEPAPSHSGVEDFTSQLKDSDFPNAGSVSLDGTVYPESLATAGTDSMGPLFLSILVPVAVIVGGIILERILTRWHNNKKQKKTI